VPRKWPGRLRLTWFLGVAELRRCGVAELRSCLRPASFPRGRRLRSLAAGVGLAALTAFRTRRLGLLRASRAFASFGSFVSFVSFAFLRFTAKALGRRAQAAADALGLRLGFRGRGLLGFGVRVELAADQLDLRDFRGVAAAEAEAQDPRVAARARLEARRDRVEQLGDDVAVLDVAEHHPARVQGAAVGLAGGQAALGDGDDPLDERPQLLRLRHRRLDPLVADQRLRLVAEHRDAMLRDPAELSLSYSVTHDYSCDAVAG